MSSSNPRIMHGILHCWYCSISSLGFARQWEAPAPVIAAHAYHAVWMTTPLDLLNPPHQADLLQLYKPRVDIHKTKPAYM